MINIENKRVLFCDLDGTLIKTVSKAVFPKDVTDFQIRKDVLDKVKDLGCFTHIAIVTNQAGIPKFVNKEDFVAKLCCIAKFIEKYCSVNVKAVWCSSSDSNHPCRKPNPGMLEDLYEEYYDPMSKSMMMMIGDASGKPGCFSDSDLKCAENFGIDYMDVEDFVML